MGIWAKVTGNLTKNPEGRTVVANGEPRALVELRVFADVNRKVGDRWEQDDERSTAVDVTIWSESLGAVVLQHFRKGARVVVEGEMHLNEYEDSDNVHHAGLRLTAESVALVPYRIDSLVFTPSRREREAADA
ncbi:Single-stranded DNA-binding protein [Rubrivivax sp. A210]|uniref:single-stranded DNA-binding protein n=1 Tax=Rubrivivax sp. A210 TaxID=2772301 RepID=UPI00191ABD60|nr:single-stranded DNA-binding protein [Rubrivivax sp. A210]CAD5366564.1 Single-stranded DNA-binding protein [Rubrivivax sp. A210]